MVKLNNIKELHHKMEQKSPLLIISRSSFKYEWQGFQTRLPNMGVNNFKPP